MMTRAMARRGTKPACAAALLLAGVTAMLLPGCDRRGWGPASPPATTTASAPSAASGPAQAAATPASGPVIPPQAFAPPSNAQVQAGAALAGEGATGVAPCASCHGRAGEGNAATGYPRIAGQSYAYLLHQLESYADDRRQHPVMAPIAKAMTREQRGATAAHYAALMPVAPQTSGPPPAASAPRPTPQRLARGSQLAERGDESRLVQGCANCHGPQGRGAGNAYPYLAGQYASYLSAALDAWRNGTRGTDPSGQMPVIVRSLQPADLEAVVAYYAQLPPPATPRDRDVAAPGAAASSAARTIVSGPRGADAGPQGTGTEQGAPVTGGGQGPGGGGGGTGAGPSGGTGGTGGDTGGTRTAPQSQPPASGSSPGR